MSHMSAIGFDVPIEEFQALVTRGAPEASRFDTAIGSYLQWALGSGVELWLQINAVEKIVGCNPHFVGTGEMPVALIETASVPGRPLDGSGFGWAAPRDTSNPNSGLHAFAANLPNFAYVDERILMPPVVTLQIAAFASALEFFPTESAYIRSEWGQYYQAEPGVTTWQTVENEGMPQPQAFLTGFVTASECRRNPVTGQEFHTLGLQTSAGSIDVVADMATVARRPVVGTVVAGNFWLSALPISPLPPPRVPAAFQRARAHL
jgi:hypothetical protein